MESKGNGLREMAAQYGIGLSDEMLQQFSLYGELLREWNQKINLTAIVDEEGIQIKHFLDSLLLIHALEKRGISTEGSRIIDVGTGAGFPGVPFAIARPTVQLTLLDGLNKRVIFLRELCGQLGMAERSEAIHGRGEEYGRKPEYREKFQIATARAVADLRELSEYCIPFVEVGGYFGALKGYDIEEELKGASKAISLLGGKVEAVEKYVLPDGSRRSIVCIKKISHTTAQYPRPSAKIAKFPLK